MCNSTPSATDLGLTDLGLTDKNHACSCGTDDHSGVHADARVIEKEGAVREHYLVDGMTCSHCVASVTEELSAVNGVESVSVDLHAGGTSRVMIVSSQPVPVGDVRAAVIEAGYSLVTI